MNILGLVFPASFFQQSDQQQTLQSNDSMGKCSDVSYIARTLKSSTKEVLQGVKSLENPIYNESSKKIYGPDVRPVLSSYVNKSVGLVSNPSTDELVKRTSKKKKKKKKLNKMSLDNDADKASADLASLTCPSTQSSSKEISCRTGLTEFNQKGAMVSYQSSKEVVDDSVHNKIDAKFNSTCSHSTLNSEGSKHLSSSGDIGSLSSINKVSSEIAVLQDLTFRRNKVDKISNTKVAKKQGKSTITVPSSAVVRPITGSEPIGAYLQDSRDYETKLSTKPHHDNSDPKGSHILPQYGDHRSTRICGNSSNQINYVAERSNMSQDKVIGDSDCMTKWNSEASHTSRSIDCKVQGTTDLRIVMGVKEVSGDDNNKEVQSSNQCSMVSDAPTVAPSQDVKHEKGHSQTSIGTSRMPSRVNNHKQIGKENAHFIWQKTGKNIGDLQNGGRKKSNHDHLWTDACSRETISQPNRNSATDDGLLPSPQLSYICRDGLRDRVENLGISDHEMLRSHRNVLVESPEWVVQQRFNAELGQYVSRSREDEVLGNRTCARSKDKLNQSFKKENVNYYKRGFWISKPNLSKPVSRSNFVHREALEVPRTTYLHRSNIAEQRSSHGNHHHKSDNSEIHVFECVPSFSPRSSHVDLHEPWTQTSGRQKLFYEIQQHAGKKIPRTEDIKGEAFHALLAEENTASACELPYEPRVSLQKWIPVGKKESSVVKTNGGDKASNNSSVAVCEAASVTDASNGMRQFVGLSDSRQVDCLDGGAKDHSASDYKPKKLSIYIGSEMAVQALDAAYSLQIASERVQLATGSPIAEFEKLLYYASPVIIPSFVQQYCEDTIRYQPILSSFSKFHNPDFLLRDVWSWYERPGNYGLEVKTEDSQNSEGLETEVFTFSAHFVPFLSAVQLFGHSHHSFVGSRAGDLSTDMPNMGETEKCSFSSSCPELVEKMRDSNLNSVEKHMRQFNLATSDGHGYSSSSTAFCSSDDSEVIFEYFEHEPPQQRKPLYAKIKELVEVGTSNPQVFGDPSKLECINLQDLHPASWYSVAWYPIYRIPVGSFRASFLTYHSLGHLVLRRIKSDSPEENAFSVVSPVLGMQSYNAQGECWFYPKKLAESHSDDGMRYDSSEILKERLRTLETTAVLFARGHVHKGHIDVPNRHPDYEFFLSRKQ